MRMHEEDQAGIKEIHVEALAKATRAVNSTRYQRLFHALADAGSFKRWPFRRIPAHQANFLYPITPTGSRHIWNSRRQLVSS